MMAAIRSRYGSPSDLTTGPEVCVVQRMQPQPHINMHSVPWLLISSEAGHGRYTFKSTRLARGNFRHCVGREKTMTKLRLHGTERVRSAERVRRLNAASVNSIVRRLPEEIVRSHECVRWKDRSLKVEKLAGSGEPWQCE